MKAAALALALAGCVWAGFAGYVLFEIVRALLTMPAYGPVPS